MGLVDYGSSSEDEDTKNNNTAPASPPVTSKPGSSLFSALPPPKQGKPSNTNETNKRKEVTVKIPLATTTISKKDNDDEDEWEEDAGTGPEKKRKLTSNSGIASALSFLPAPKHEISKAPPKPEPKAAPVLPKQTAPLLKPEFDEEEKEGTSNDTNEAEEAKPKTDATSSIPAPQQTNGKKPPIKAKTSAQPQRRIALSFKQQAFAELLKSQPEDEPPQESTEQTTEQSTEEQPTEQASMQDPNYLPPYQDGTDQSAQNAQGYYDPNYYGQQYAQYGYYPPAVPKAPPVDPRTLPRAFREMLQSGSAQFTEVKQDNLRHSFFNYTAPDAETFYKPRPMDDSLTHNHKRQNHVSYLAADLQNKMAALEQKRADSRRTKQESRSKYGW